MKRKRGSKWINRNVYNIIVSVPKVWKRLVKLDFPANLKGIKSEKHDHFGLADPQPHYDDARVICGSFPDGTVFTLQLCSGQSNYWGGYTFDRYRSEYAKGFNDKGELVVDSEPLDNFNFADDLIEVVMGGVRYVVSLNFC